MSALRRARPTLLHVLIAGLLALALLPLGAVGGPPAAQAAGTTWTVQTTTDDATPGACTGTSCTTLRDALGAAADGDTIVFAPSVSSIITTTSTLWITASVTLTGPGTSALALSGNGDHTVVFVTGDVTATVSGLTIEDGNGSDGGGIINQGALTLEMVVVTGNAATGDSFGGGIYNDGTQPGHTTALTLTASTVANNSADYGGGLYGYGAFGGSAPITLTNTLVVGSAGSGDDCTLNASTLADQGGNLADDGSCSLTQPTSLQNVSTLVVGPLSSYGGPTQTLPLPFGSPARDLGVPAGCVANNGQDQR